MSVAPWTVRLDPPAVAINRTELDLNSGPIRVDQKGIDFGDAQITPYMANEQRWGSGVVSYRVPNRIVTIPLGLGMDDSGDQETARAQLQQKVALLQREGGILLRQRADGPPMYADIVNATYNPLDVLGETGDVEPGLSLSLECLPDFYGDPITLDTINATGETTAVLEQDGKQAVIAGDHPGRAQLVVIDGSANSQYGMFWALRSRYHDSASTAGLAYAAAQSLAPATGSVVSALAGARYGQVITNTAITSAWTYLAWFGGSHVGSYQVWARVYNSSPGVSYRLAWAIGDGGHGLILNSRQALPAPVGFYLLNLGQVRLDPTPAGVQQWTAAIQALSAAGIANASIDMLYLQPLDEASGELSGVAANSNPVMLASGRMQLRWDGAIRAIPGGAAFMPLVPDGDLLRIPPSAEGRPVQLLLKPSRGDLASRADSGYDAFSVAVSYRPCWIGRP